MNNPGQKVLHPMSTDRQAVHSLILKQCARTPERTAISCGDLSISYHELGRQIRSVAACLTEHGFSSEAIIGLYFNRSIDFVAAALGVLHAGCAYLPLNPHLPSKRLSYMAENAEIQALLFNCPLPDDIVLPDKSKTFSFENVSALSVFTDKEESRCDLSMRAYVIYTSGSTGYPKGVEVLHRNILSFQQSVLQSPGISEKDIVVSVASFSFDMSGFDIYPALSCGAHLVIATDTETRDGRLLADLLDRKNATLLKSTPATWHLLLQINWPGKKNLRLVSGGDMLSWEVAHELLKRVNTLWNVYGPTETTIHCTEYPVDTNNSFNTASVPIGKPLANCQLYLLDDQGGQVPDMKAGEIYIAGEQVSRGYLNNPELTKERFIRDPFDSDRKMYRTGDRARRLPDGNTEILGRADHQIKLRGYRIELPEIELTLQKHELIRQAAVIVREDMQGGKRIVAYVTKMMPEADLWSDELRAYLGKKLPAYMLPSAFVILDKMPLTISGKPDRKNLPVPEQAVLAIDSGAMRKAKAESDFHKEITGALGLELTELWEELLGFRPGTIYDDFFALGGHSLLAMRLLHRIEEKLGVILPLSALYPRATIADLAIQVIKQQDRTKSSYRLAAVRPDGHKPALFIVHPVSGQIAILVNLMAGMDPDQPVYAFESNAQYPEEKPSIEELAQTYIALMKQRQPAGPYYLAGPSMGGWIAFEMALRLTAAGDEVALMAAIDSAPKIRKTTVAMGDSPVLDEAQCLAAAVMTLRGHAGGIKAVRQSREDFGAAFVRSLPEAERWQQAAERLKTDKVLEPDFPDSQLKRVLKTLMAHTLAFYNYQFPRPGNFPITVIVNTHPSEVPYKVWACENNDNVWGWTAWTTATVDGPHAIEGGDDHWTMLRRPDSLLKVAAVLQQSLDKAASGI